MTPQRHSTEYSDLGISSGTLNYRQQSSAIWPMRRSLFETPLTLSWHRSFLVGQRNQHLVGCTCENGTQRVRLRQQRLNSDGLKLLRSAQRDIGAEATMGWS